MQWEQNLLWDQHKSASVTVLMEKPNSWYMSALGGETSVQYIKKGPSYPNML